MGGDMSCCLIGTASDRECAVRSCAGNDFPAALATAPLRAVLAPVVTLPERFSGPAVSIPAEPLPLTLSDGPPAPPPRA